MRFEDMAFETKVGGVSPVFLTKYGYHFLLVKERAPGQWSGACAAHPHQDQPKDDNAANTRQEALAQHLFHADERGRFQ